MLSTHQKKVILPSCKQVIQGKSHFAPSPLVLQPLLLLAADAAMATACYVESIEPWPGPTR